MRFKLNIRRRLMIIVLSLNVVTLIILSGVYFFGMNSVRTRALESAEDIGNRSALNSTGTLEMQKKKEMSLLAGDKSNAINHHLSVLSGEVKKIADEMTYINSHAYLFPQRMVRTPDAVAAEEIAFYVQRAEGVNTEDIRAELGLTANIRDFLIRAVETNEMAHSMTVASRNHFNVTVDDNRTIEPVERQAAPMIFDAPAADWYQRAIVDRYTIFTEIHAVDDQTLEIYCAAPYFDPNGEVAGAVCAQASLNTLKRLVEEVSMHDEGFCFVLDNRGRMILSSDKKFRFEEKSAVDFRTVDNPAFADIAVQMVDGFKGIREAEYNGKNYYISYAPIDQIDWSFAVVIDAGVVNQPIIENAELIKNLTQKSVGVLDSQVQSTMIFLGVFIVILLMASVHVGRRLSDHFVEPIHRLSDGVREISTGDLNKKIEIKTGDEIESLAISFNAMTEQLQTYIANLTRVTADKERIATELNVASNIQQSMLPNIFPPFPERKEFDLYATMHAAKEVGGDFYDFYFIDNDHLMLTIADVSGKGVPAALFMVIAKTILKNCALTPGATEDLASVLTRANWQLSQNNDEFMFVTVFAAVLDLKTGRLNYVNGGHNPPLVKQNDWFKYLKLEKSCALGINEFAVFEQKSLMLEAGDVLFLYTDGVTEAMNVNGEQYTDERLINRLNAVDGRATVEEIISSVGADLKEHASGAEQSDDITMLALRLNFLDGNGDKG